MGLTLILGLTELRMLSKKIILITLLVGSYCSTASAQFFDTFSSFDNLPLNSNPSSWKSSQPEFAPIVLNADTFKDSIIRDKDGKNFIRLFQKGDTDLGKSLFYSVTVPTRGYVKTVSFQYAYFRDSLSPAFVSKVAQLLKDTGTGTFVLDQIGYLGHDVRKSWYPDFIRFGAYLGQDSGLKPDSLRISFKRNFLFDDTIPEAFYVKGDMIVEYSKLVSSVKPTLPKDIKLYPNPAHEKIYLSNRQISGRFWVYNLNGVLVENTNFDSFINIGFLPNGLYQLIIQDEKGEYFHAKFQKE